MAIIKSISGIRGTLGEKNSEGLSATLLVEYCLAYATLLNRKNKNQVKVVVGRDGRISGEVLESLVVATFRLVGVNIIQIGHTTTPTLEMAVVFANADAGVILTASHNPANWNALKFFNEKGEFISAEIGQKLMQMIDEKDFEYACENELGALSFQNDFFKKHIDAVLNLPIINKKVIADANFTVVADAINSTGSLILPMLFEALSVKYSILNNNCNGIFAHNPEPLPAHLAELATEVKKQKADLGIAVDPDVDRLALVCEDGEMLGEEYTLVAAADHVLFHTKGNTVSNLSSTQALCDITEKYDCKYFSSAVGEVNVVAKMKDVNAIIGGEGNGGVIYPTLHYGRDAIVGIALILSLMAERKKSLSQLKKEYPAYFMAKERIDLPANISIDQILDKVETCFAAQSKYIDKTDGLKIGFNGEWAHLRKSNTEPIIRIYTESNSAEAAQNLAKKFVDILVSYAKDSTLTKNRQNK